jgi:hypothetical protein
MPFAQKTPEERRSSIAQLMGEEMATYVRNKATGGSNGKKGARYEDFFAAFTLAQILADKSKEEAQSEWPDIFDQVFAFVDDLVVITTDASKYHQLKNAKNLTWLGGNHSIANDFEHQMQLSSHEGEPQPRTILVIAHPDVALEMRANIPQVIAAHSEVVYFPYADGHLNRLVMEYEPLRTALATLTRTADANPPADELGYVFGALVTSFLHRGHACSSQVLLECAQKQSPALIRLLPNQTKDIQISPEFVKVLAQIPNLKYVTETGFFCWSCLTDSGVLPYNCLDTQFRGFQTRVVKGNPATFDEFEVHLL